MFKTTLAVCLLGCVALSQAYVSPAYAEVGTIYDKSIYQVLNARSPRIMGGTVASLNEYPHQVGIISSASINPNEEDGFCGGSLISNRVVLTAAHCIDTYLVSDVILGTNKVMDDGSTGYTRIRAERKLLHPSFNLSTIDYDIAMLFLSEDAPIAANIKPVMLPKKSYTANLVGQSGRLTGWGKTGDGTGFINDDLLEVDVGIIENQECIAAYGERFVNDRKVCVSTNGGTKGPCHGDSGGPLTIRTNLPSETIQVGIVSFGAAQGCESGFPTVFSRITSYIQWIADNDGPAVRP